MYYRRLYLNSQKHPPIYKLEQKEESLEKSDKLSEMLVQNTKQSGC
jgi:hypothetical protein